ncbi:recombinase family protein [Thiobacillus sedimenti]|uniref:Recombinase family protein n=1 Tax=Thiobacillus sedimenti TaxID=3110231 RepID=A0ABZ1CJ68_9PROT|nr:recombinase family protein [Thiobacillus sp. SCUT-2]WRS39244.1 recombinase family protein [Thiobacillus sp. SCUT-2]
MSPFVVFPGELSLRSNPRQQGLAELLGHEQAAYFESFNETIDAGTVTGKLAFHLFSALAEFERNLISERTREGLNVARRRGNKDGHKPALIPSCEAGSEIDDGSLQPAGGYRGAAQGQPINSLQACS